MFSSTIIDGHIRNALKYTGVVISDSMSAEALSSYDVSQLGVKLVEAGGDMSCIGQTDYVKPIVDGLNERGEVRSGFRFESDGGGDSRNGIENQDGTGLTAYPLHW